MVPEFLKCAHILGMKAVCHGSNAQARDIDTNRMRPILPSAEELKKKTPLEGC